MPRSRPTLRSLSLVFVLAVATVTRAVSTPAAGIPPDDRDRSPRLGPYDPEPPAPPVPEPPPAPGNRELGFCSVRADARLVDQLLAELRAKFSHDLAASAEDVDGAEGEGAAASLAWLCAPPPTCSRPPPP
jgi:hypothetical protein